MLNKKLLLEALLSCRRDLRTRGWEFVISLGIDTPTYYPSEKSFFIIINEMAKELGRFSLPPIT